MFLSCHILSLHQSYLPHQLPSAGEIPGSKTSRNHKMVCHASITRSAAEWNRYEIYYEIILGGRFADKLDVLHQRYRFAFFPPLLVHRIDAERPFRSCPLQCISCMTTTHCLSALPSIPHFPLCSISASLASSSNSFFVASSAYFHCSVSFTFLTRLETATRSAFFLSWSFF